MLPPLSYRLRKSTRVQLRPDAVYLLLDYPLKTAVVHSAWRPVFDHLARESFVPLDELERLMNGLGRKKIAGFLDNLLHKGFLERSGTDILDEYPTLSVIIPVRNRPAEIDACLRALQQVDYPAAKLEIIVVDDASADDTPRIVEKYPVRLIRLKRHRQASFCRNLGARLATGEILAFIDSDCMADPAWLKQLLPAFNDPFNDPINDSGLAAVGGRIGAYYESKKLDLYEKAKSSLMVSSHAKRSERGDPFFYVPACNFLVRRNVFLNAGGFDVHLSVGEDVDLCWRLAKQGCDIEFRPEGVVYHRHRNRLWAFCRRRFDYGTSEPMLQKRHPDKVKRFLIPPAAAAFCLFLLLWAWTGQLLFAGIACLVVLTDSLLKKRRYKYLAIDTRMIVWSTVRSYAAFCYHLCAFGSRYYLMPAILCSPLAPAATAVIGSMHLVNALVEYRLKKPKLNLPVFIFYFTLEQLSYQAGVWWGCFRHRLFRPLLPKPVIKGNV